MRLKTIAGLVTPGYTVADIGTDHGYVPLLLLKNSIVPTAIASDMSPGALAKAVENARRMGLEDKVDFRCCNGLEKISPGEAQCIVISGMGGILMRRILDEGLETVLAAKELILSPHRDPELILEFLETNGFETVSDQMIEDKKKKYRIIKGIH